MWCACPTRSPHSPSASSCPKPIPLLNLRPSPAEWAPYPPLAPCPACASGFFVPLRKCRPPFCAKLPLILALSPPSVGTSPAAEPKTRSFPLRSFDFVREVPTSARTSPAAEPITRSFSRRASASAHEAPAAEPSPRSFSCRSSAFPFRSPIRRHAPAEREGKAPHRHDAPPGGVPASPHPTQKRPNLTPSRRKNVTLSTHSF